MSYSDPPASVRSLEQQQYYGHPQNHFWKILGALWGEDLLALPYAQRCAQAVAHGLGLWDVYARCERAGSLDSAIRNAELRGLTLADFDAEAGTLFVRAGKGGKDRVLPLGPDDVTAKRIERRTVRAATGRKEA